MHLPEYYQVIAWQKISLISSKSGGTNFVVLFNDRKSMLAQLYCLYRVNVIDQKTCFTAEQYKII